MKGSVGLLVRCFGIRTGHDFFLNVFPLIADLRFVPLQHYMAVDSSTVVFFVSFGAYNS